MEALQVTPRRDDRRDPREATRIGTRFADELMKFEKLLNLGFSNDDLGRMHSKELLVEIALHYMNRGVETTAHHYADFEEITNASLV
jgi:hypothetical protein